MALQKHLKNAPIIEALIDIQVKLPLSIDVTHLKSISTSISQQYPSEMERMKGGFTFRLGRTAEASATDVSLYGYTYSSDDKKQILQVRLDGFTFSRLKPYEKWEHLRDEAYRLWQLYVELAKPEAITRIALRYINRLEIPPSLKDLKEYITAPPLISPALPNALSSFLTRVVVPVPSVNAVAITTQALEPVITGQDIPVILDIDVFMEGDFKVNEDIWRNIDTLRDLKNKIFFESITETMAELCN